jgi:RNase P subunit RPR2
MLAVCFLRRSVKPLDAEFFDLRRRRSIYLHIYLTRKICHRCTQIILPYTTQQKLYQLSFPSLPCALLQIGEIDGQTKQRKWRHLARWCCQCAIIHRFSVRLIVTLFESSADMYVVLGGSAWRRSANRSVSALGVLGAPYNARMKTVQGEGWWTARCIRGCFVWCCCC